ncbi:NAD(P)(+) transhydrogenase (Re/Si-specific) subunit beta [Ilumatobacter nonamiensis]|uniref:NAD(P)(+) transhydrogenase (Re/Si-specific) subunit beta n=1 Tax=Ilumatobacter nonamiensis TaxID=467093 RepID=UPI0011D1CA72|nr:NAD(P)(+) transhydrogenase (Re/Si-specific) subunit beta [Ilumatobacter nonamiensis]
MSDESAFPSPGGTGLDRRGTIWGLIGVAITIAVTFVGSDALDLAILGWLPTAALVGAFVAWSATALGLAHLGVTTVRRTGSRPSTSGSG